ncbi:MAG: hypothetical protein ACTSP0_00680 [Alphaproteobacteria bacterium]
MASKNRVLRSIETVDGMRCVDFFIRPDGSFGFEEYRRDTEDTRGWFPIGFHAEKVFVSENEAEENALKAVSWLRGAL